MKFNIVLLVSIGVFVGAKGQLIINEHTPQNLFDDERYESVLDSAECVRQLNFLRRNDSILFGRFLDAGIRFPRGIYLMSSTDMGQYQQCLRIDEQRYDMNIAGKYCFLEVPLNQTFQLLGIDENVFPERDFSNKKIVRFNNGIVATSQAFAVPERFNDVFDIQELIATAEISFAICVPEVCTSLEWVQRSFFNMSALGFQYREEFCRLPNDKPWAPVDYVAIGIFSLIVLLTSLGTLYDINHTHIQKKDPKKAIVYFRMFSIYTNSRRLMTFAPNANALDCLDGIRVISMLWVIVGHSFSMQNFNINLLDAINWLTSGDAVWVSTGLFAVDSFFLMAGLLLVYTSRGKMSGMTFLKRLHVFYLNRLLRMFPLLATLVLLEASVFHRMADGPYWVNVARNVQRCRTFWWSTLLHVQNYVNPDDMCIQHSWYISIDIQLHIVAPIVLFWVLGKSKKAAWSALISGFLAILVASTIFNFIMELPSSNMSIVRLDEQARYMNYYYVNTLTRGAPFFVGMICGYILNVCKGKQIKLNMGFVLISWVITLGLFASCFYTSYMIMQLDWDNQVGDSLFNSFMRTVWSVGLSWIIFACSKGYGGPINTLLTLSIWKVPARISYAMYLYHFPIMFVVAGIQMRPDFFSQGGRIFDAMAFMVIALWVSFLVTVVIDAPFSTIIKMALERGQGRRKPPVEKAVKSLPEKNTITTLEKDEGVLEKDDIYDILIRNSRVETNLTILQKNGDLAYSTKKAQDSDKNGPASVGNGTNLERKLSLQGEMTESLDNNKTLDRIESIDVEPETVKISKF